MNEFDQRADIFRNVVRPRGDGDNRGRRQCAELWGQFPRIATSLHWRSKPIDRASQRYCCGPTYPDKSTHFLGVRDDHHSYSHPNTGKEYQAIVKCHVELYAYLIGKLAKMQEGERTVLDNSCIMFMSEHWNAHNGKQVPLILAGGLGGTLATGRTLDYLKAGNDKRKLCSLYLSIMDRMGLKLPEFGDAKERLAGI